MKTLLSAAAACAVLAAAPSAQASIVYGIQATTGKILTIDPTTGAILNTYRTPQTIASTQVHAGLSYAAPLNQLLYIDTSTSIFLFRLDPTTGVVLTTARGDFFENSGVSYERVGSTDVLFYAHTSDDVHHQSGFGGSTTFFFTPGAPTGGLGGDGYGREFEVDGTSTHEYNVNTGAFIKTLAAPVGAVGLAFDGAVLYVSTTGGGLLTLNASTGAVLNTVTVAGGDLIELGAQFSPTVVGVPEPGSVALLGLGLAGLAAARRRRR